MQSPFNRVIIRSPFIDEYDRFSQLAEECARAGITHLTFTEIERAFWEIDDPNDPYLHWSIVHTSMFKIFPPELLRNWVPRDYAQRAQEAVAKKARILKKHGLKGATFLYDPTWWPEEIFLQYPELRGPRADQPRRCIHPRFAPCIDRPEVLEMYKQAFKQLSEVSEGVLDTVIFRANDSGAGFCWCDGLYNSPNGPEHCRHIGFAERIKKFFDVIREGVKEAGGDPQIYIGGNISEREREMLIALHEKCGYYVHGGANDGGERILTGRQLSFPHFPVKGVSNPVVILEKMAQAYESGYKDIVFFTFPTMYGSDWNGDSEIVQAMGHFIKNPSSGFLSKIDILKKIAAENFGNENVDDMVSAWMDISQACENMKKYDRGMNMIFLGVLAQRWLTRPFVVIPEELTEEEKSHYVSYLFQPDKSHKNLDLLDCQGTRSFDGMRQLRLFNQDMNLICQKYKNAQKKITKAYERGGKKDKKLKEKITSLEILLCLLKNIRNCVNFQIFLENIRKKTEKYSDPSDLYALLEEDRSELYGIMRSEIENCHHLAELLEKTKCEMIFFSKTKEGETPFMLGPTIVQDLRKKAEIMTKRWLDMNKLVAPPNK